MNVSYTNTMRTDIVGCFDKGIMIVIDVAYKMYMSLRCNYIIYHLQLHTSHFSHKNSVL